MAAGRPLRLRDIARMSPPAAARPGKVAVEVLGMSRKDIPRYYQLSAKVAAALSKNPGLAEDLSLIKGSGGLLREVGPDQRRGGGI